MKLLFRNSYKTIKIFFPSKLNKMKIRLLFASALIIVYTASYGQQADCEDWTDAQWKIGPTWNSSKVTPCHPNAYYNCNGFVLSFFENGCQPTGPQQAPYLCPEAQGDLGNGSITSNGKVLEVCNATQGNIVFYDVGSGYGYHSAVKTTYGGATKYLSKYGTDGPLVAHDIEGSYYHYVVAPTIDGHYAYVGMSGNPNITGTGTVTFSSPSVSGASYLWSIQSGGSNIYVQSGGSSTTVTLKPLHSGTAVLKLITNHSCSSAKTQTLTLNIDTQICLEGTYVNGGSTSNLMTGNSVSTGSVSTTVTCPGAASYTWTRTSGSLSYYASGNFMSFTMTSGSSVSFQIKAKNSSYQVIGTRNVSYYNYGSYAAFPNPATSTFEIDVAENQELEIIAFEETDNTKVKKLKKYRSKDKIDVSKWKKGNYILHIYHKEKLVKIGRLTVQ